MKAHDLSTDPVAADTAATRLFGMKPKDVLYLGMAAEAGCGKMDLSRLDIRRINL